MHSYEKTVLLIAMPFAETSIPSIQLSLLGSHLNERNINITSKHFYLKTADFYGLHNYNYLINNPNDSYAAQMVFSKYLFPDHWEKNIEKFRYFYDNIIGNKDFLNNFPFERYIEKSDNFLSWAFKHLNLEAYDIIGFTLNYGQFLPSLTLAKKIKENYPEKTIVFGGSTIINELGKRVLKTFSWIDFIISGEGEEPLFQLATDYDNYNSIPGLIYRNNDEIIWNENENYIDLNSLPYPDFQSYFHDLCMVSAEIQQYYSLFGRLPIELSRGCWWNNCTFCNLREYHKKYREKTIDRFVEELDFLSESYKNLTFQLIGNTLPQHGYRDLCEQIIKLDKDFDLYIEARAGQLKANDYKLLKKAGFNHIQTGIETFSTNYIKKMNKGVKVIDNIAALKYCKENEIFNSYNIIVNYPNEEQKDFGESEKNIDLIRGYLDPPQISKYVVGYGSPIYTNPEQFNILELEYKIIDTIMFPPEFLENNFTFFYQFKRQKEVKENNWKKLVQNWKEEKEKRETKYVKRKTTVNKKILYYIDGITFLKIFDNRNHESVAIYILDQIERDIFLNCHNVISFKQLKNIFSNLSEIELQRILDNFEEIGIVFKDDDYYLSLPLSYNLLCHNLEKEEKQKILNQKLIK